jgi:hypothetical protein
MTCAARCCREQGDLWRCACECNIAQTACELRAAVWGCFACFVMQAKKETWSKSIYCISLQQDRLPSFIKFQLSAIYIWLLTSACCSGAFTTFLVTQHYIPFCALVAPGRQRFSLDSRLSMPLAQFSVECSSSGRPAAPASNGAVNQRCQFGIRGSFFGESLAGRAGGLRSLVLWHGNPPGARRRSGRQEQAAVQSSSAPLSIKQDRVKNKVRSYAEVAYLTGRAKVVTQHFNTALGMDDFMNRLEIALFAFGFHSDNSIGAGQLLISVWVGRPGKGWQGSRVQLFCLACLAHQQGYAVPSMMLKPLNLETTI